MSNIDVTPLRDEPLYKEFQIVIEAREIVQSTDAEILEAAKTFKLAGFREGKVPLSLVKRQIGQQVLHKHINHKISEVLQKVMNQKGLNYSTPPNVEIQDFQPEEALTFIAKIDVLPTIPKIDMKSDNLKIETLELKITEEDLREAQKAVINATKVFKKVEDNQYASKEGDAVVIDFLGKINGEEFEGNRASSIQIVLGGGQFIPEFESKLIGLTKGITTSIDVKFPVDYHNKDIAGQDAVFEIVVHDILVTDDSEQELNDEFAQKIGIESLEKLNEMLKQRIQNDFHSIARLRTKKRLFDRIDASYNFDIPQKMLDADYELMWNEIRDNLAKTNPNKSEQEVQVELKDIARRRVKLGLILAEIAKDHKIVLSNEDILAAKETEKMRLPDKSQEIEAFFQKSENIERIRGALLEEKVVDYLISQVPTEKITVTPKEFNEKYAKEIQ